MIWIALRKISIQKCCSVFWSENDIHDVITTTEWIPHASYYLRGATLLTNKSSVLHLARRTKAS